jgi:putative membrane protein
MTTLASTRPTTWLLRGAMLALLPLAACSQTEKAVATTEGAVQAQVNPTLSTTDATFIDTAARGGVAEVQMGELAQKKGATAAVRNFGARMVADHSRVNTELAQLAQTKQISAPTEPNTMQTQEIHKLQGLRGRAFDREYVQVMSQDHRDDISLFQNESESGTDADVRAFASRTLPTLREHLAMVDRMAPRRATTRPRTTSTQKP